MIVVCAREKPTFGHHLDEITKVEFIAQIPAHTEDAWKMISRSKWRPLKRASMFNMPGQFHRGTICRRISAASALCTRTRQPAYCETGRPSSGEHLV